MTNVDGIYMTASPPHESAATSGRYEPGPNDGRGSEWLPRSVHRGLWSRVGSVGPRCGVEVDEVANRILQIRVVLRLPDHGGGASFEFAVSRGDARVSRRKSRNNRA
jgi:hypothetical protein